MTFQPGDIIISPRKTSTELARLGSFTFASSFQIIYFSFGLLFFLAFPGLR